MFCRILMFVWSFGAQHSQSVGLANGPFERLLLLLLLVVRWFLLLIRHPGSFLKSGGLNIGPK